jgi:hypothetical protein
MPPVRETVDQEATKVSSDTGDENKHDPGMNREAVLTLKGRKSKRLRIQEARDYCSQILRVTRARETENGVGDFLMVSG